MNISEKHPLDIEKKITSEEKAILIKFLNEIMLNAGKQKTSQYKAFVLKLRDTLNKKLTDLTREDLVQYWNLLKNSSYKWNSQVMQRKYIKRFIRFQYGITKANEMLNGLKAGEFKASERYTKQGNLTAEELEKIIRTADTLRDKAILSLLYETASRPEELLKLTWNKKDIDLEKEEVNLFSSKTGKPRTIPIKESIVHLKRWKQEYQYPNLTKDDLIFPSQKRGEILTTASLNRIIQRIIKKANIKKDVTAYTFRHSRLTEIYNKGVQGFDHNLFAGHKKGSKQQAVYVKTDEEEMKKAMLEKVFHIENIEPEKKAELEKEIKKQNEVIEGLLERVQLIELRRGKR
jgi:integrase